MPSRPKAEQLKPPVPVRRNGVTLWPIYVFGGRKPLGQVTDAELALLQERGWITLRTLLNGHQDWSLNAALSPERKELRRRRAKALADIIRKAETGEPLPERPVKARKKAAASEAHIPELVPIFVGATFLQFADKHQRANLTRRGLGEHTGSGETMAYRLTPVKEPLDYTGTTASLRMTGELLADQCLRGNPVALMFRDDWRKLAAPVIHMESIPERPWTAFTSATKRRNPR